jgi:putative SOS response-associated peptidase YedK
LVKSAKVAYRTINARAETVDKALSFRQAFVAQIHPRMPVILPEQHHEAWLGETDDGNLKELLVPYPTDQMRMWEISPLSCSPTPINPRASYKADCSSPLRLAANNTWPIRA